MTGDEALAWAHANLPADPLDVERALKDAGWVKVGGRTGEYIRFARPGDGRRTLLLPLNPEYPDYADMMAGTLAGLAIAAEEGRQAQAVLHTLGRENQRRFYEAWQADIDAGRAPDPWPRTGES